MKPYTIILLFACLLFSCKKDNSDNFTGTLKATGIIVTAPRLFTNGVEIKNKAIVEKYISSWQYFNPKFNPNNDDAIKFITKDTALFSGSNLKYSVKKENNLFLFYSTMQGNLGDEAFYDMWVYTDTKTRVPLPGNSSAVMVRHMYVGFGGYDQIGLVATIFKKTYSNAGSYAGSYGTMFNVFKESSISSLTVHDTLAIQQCEYIFKRR